LLGDVIDRTDDLQWLASKRLKERIKEPGTPKLKENSSLDLLSEVTGGQSANQPGILLIPGLTLGLNGK
jgi:hypothetical protein